MNRKLKQRKGDTINIKSYKLQNGQTRYRFYLSLGFDRITGKRKSTSRSGFKTKAEARQKYLEIIHENDTISNGATFGEVYKQWLEIYKMTVKESTFYTTQRKFNRHILSVFENVKIDKITYIDLQKFTNKKSKELKNFKEIVTYTSKVFEHAIRLDLIKQNPCDLVIYPRTTFEPYKPPIYTESELIEFLKCCRKDLPFEWFIIFYLYATTGCRRGEILGLNWTDLNGDVLTINRTLTRGKTQITDTPKTPRSKRTIIVDSYCVGLLKEWKTLQTKVLGFQEIMFTNSTGGYINLARTRDKLQHVIKRNNLPHITVHGIRHTYATLMDKNQTVRKRTLQEILGHSNDKMTNHYNHVYVNEQRKAVNDFSNIIHDQK